MFRHTTTITFVTDRELTDVELDSLEVSISESVSNPVVYVSDQHGGLDLGECDDADYDTIHVGVETESFRVSTVLPFAAAGVEE